jgi:thiamine biosynthesis lipoprotein
VRRLQRHLRLALGAVLLATLPGSALGANKPAKRPGLRDARALVERTRDLMGGTCVIAAESKDEAWTGRCIEAAFDEIARLDGVIGSRSEDSELARVNAAGAETRIPCSPDLIACIDSSLAIAAETGGAFDPTVEPLNRVWDVRGKGRIPEPDELHEAREKVDWHNVAVVDGDRTVRLNRPGMGLDFGGIGKGFSLEIATNLLRMRGVKRALLSLGSQVSAFTDGEAWVIHIADPADAAKPAVRLIIRQGSISTSSQGEEGFSANGRRYGHIFDPRHGDPVDSRASVTVISSGATRADALSTALLVMGRDRAESYAAEHPDIGVLWLEPTASQTHAWKWNLGAFSNEPDANLLWMN